MAIGDVASGDVVSQFVVELGRIGLWIQALGLIIILWIVFQVISLISGRKKRKKIYEIDERLKRIEGKIDEVLKRR